MIAASVAPALASAQGIERIKRDFEDVDAGRILVVAHRGCWAAAPENTAAAIEACVRLGVDAVEIDVQMTRDGQLVVLHDSTLKRMMEGWGYVADMTLAELRAHRLYERDGAPAQQFNRPLLTSLRVSTLEEVFEAARGHLMINLEIKSNERAGFKETFDAAVRLAKQMHVEDHVFWKIPPSVRGEADAESRADARTRSLNLEGLPYVMPIVLQSSRPFEQQIADFDGTGLRSFEVVGGDLSYWPLGKDGRLIGADRNRYMLVGVLPQWSAGLSDNEALSRPQEIWGRAIDMGFDVIMTDRPEQLLRYLAGRSNKRS